MNMTKKYCRCDWFTVLDKLRDTTPTHLPAIVSVTLFCSHKAPLGSLTNCDVFCLENSYGSDTRSLSMG